MLPSPALARYHRKPLRLAGRHTRLESLTRRSRITNLGVFLLASCFAISFFLNVRFWAFHHSLYPSQQSSKLQFTTIDRPITRNDLVHLIIVPCHSIWRGSNSWLEDKDWILESYQQGAGRVNAFYEHIERRYVIASTLVFLLVTSSFKFASAELVRKDPHSLLIFSGYLYFVELFLKSLTCLIEDRPNPSLLRQRLNHTYD